MGENSGTKKASNWRSRPGPRLAPTDPSDSELRVTRGLYQAAQARIQELQGKWLVAESDLHDAERLLKNASERIAELEAKLADTIQQDMANTAMLLNAKDADYLELERAAREALDAMSGVGCDCAYGLVDAAAKLRAALGESS